MHGIFDKPALDRPPVTVRGFTLVEMMVVVAIISVIAAIAMPSYTNYITRANRSAAKAVMVRITDRQEQFFLDNKQYAPNLQALGYDELAMGVDDNGNVVPMADPDRIYIVAVGITLNGYVVGGIPQLAQVQRDANCGVLIIDQAGNRSNSGPGDNCW